MKVEFFVRLNLTLSPVYVVIYHDLCFIMAGGEKVMILSLLCQSMNVTSVSHRGQRNGSALNLKILTKCSFTLLKAQSRGKCC